mgnify:CR=1 FL=1
MSRALKVRVSAAKMLTPVVRELTLEPCTGPLPEFSAGSHVQVHLPGNARNAYSLTSDPSDSHHYRIAVRLQEASRGGSHYLHRHVEAGDTLQISPPANLFALHSTASLHILIAGGIGITPFMAHIAELAAYSPYLRMIKDDAASTSATGIHRVAFKIGILSSIFNPVTVMARSRLPKAEWWDWRVWAAPRACSALPKARADCAGSGGADRKRTAPNRAARGRAP